MHIAILLAISIHVLAAVFWAGSTFAVARVGASLLSRLFLPQVGSAIVAVVSGGYLWHVLHGRALGTGEQVLIVGAACGLLALAIQIGVTARDFLRNKTRATQQLGASSLIGQRIAAALLVIVVICMAIARFL